MERPSQRVSSTQRQRKVGGCDQELRGAKYRRFINATPNSAPGAAVDRNSWWSNWAVRSTHAALCPYGAHSLGSTNWARLESRGVPRLPGQEVWTPKVYTAPGLEIAQALHITSLALVFCVSLQSEGQELRCRDVNWFLVPYCVAEVRGDNGLQRDWRAVLWPPASCSIHRDPSLEDMFAYRERDSTALDTWSARPGRRRIRGEGEARELVKELGSTSRLAKNKKQEEDGWLAGWRMPGCGASLSGRHVVTNCGAWGVWGIIWRQRHGAGKMEALATMVTMAQPPSSPLLRA
ncbi:hypothetical protein MHUMG1_02142 [Metarhizium humberi]|uniref:Uncharacterized protein n=1 Tax=Metarhizium humberi TaxID=2596975 RepID=A0A9P8S951_9HYPO|nr:hypothetical protein MHUMG1_02142 [Metarhizium humberi]